MASFVDRNDVIDAWAHRIRKLQMLVNRKPAESADILRPEQTLLVSIKCGTMGTVFIRAVSFPAGGLLRTGGIILYVIHKFKKMRAPYLSREGFVCAPSHRNMVLSCKKEAES